MPPSLSIPFDFDLAIIGAGPVGLALAGWLMRRSATRTMSIALIDAKQPAAAQHDPRAFALSQGSRSLLAPLGWPTTAVPIKQVHISQCGYFGRTLIDCREHHLPALGYVVRYGALLSTLENALPHHTLQRFTQTKAGTPMQDAYGVTLPIEPPSGARTLRAQLLIHAEGGQYHAQSSATLNAPSGNTRAYQQVALVGVISVDTPQSYIAWERFTEEGPLALLPLGGESNASYALVWCGRPDNTQRRLHANPADFLAELGSRFGSRLGRFTEINGRASFALNLNTATALADHRTAVIGNAAQTLHPVAGQGLNLGLRDAYTLAEALSDLGPTPAALTCFAQRRRADRKLTVTATDLLARIFTHSFAPPFGALLAPSYGLALTALNCLPLFKRKLAHHMMFGQRD
ncbi:MAG: 2-octaprenyl-6-methoxyphenol hydroxylase [Glomeribacter sp. 1016415]|nr:2-octaprenyl-6-methoxyphenol hydroxylase [Glomeribacter sp. 1016415]